MLTINFRDQIVRNFDLQFNSNQIDKLSMSQQAIDQLKRRLIEECLKNLVDKTKNQNTRAAIKSALDKFKADSKMQNLLGYFKSTPSVKSALRVLSYEYNAWKIAFRKITDGSKQEYVKYAKFNVQQFLLGIQSSVKFDMQQFDREYITTNKYTQHSKTYVLEINKMRIKQNWTKQFVTDWRQRKQKTLIQLENSKKNHQNQQRMTHPQGLPQPSSGPSYVPSIQQRSGQAGVGLFSKSTVPVQQTPSTSVPKSLPQLKIQNNLSKSQPKGQNIQSQQEPLSAQPKARGRPGPKPKNLQNKQDQSQDDLSVDNPRKISKQKTVKKTASESRPSTPQPQPQPQNQNQAQAQRQPQTQVQRPQMEQVATQRKQEKRDYKMRVRLLCANLQKRRDLNLNPANIKSIADFLNTKLQLFMKGILEKTITQAKLRNYNYSKPDAGDQFKFFSKDCKSIEWSGQIKTPRNQGIYRIRYPSKLQIYSQIRVYEEETEQKLERELSDKKQIDKKRDSKVLEYLLAPRQSQTQAWIPKTQAKTVRLVISNNHVQSVLEQHPIFCDGIAMFKSLHY